MSYQKDLVAIATAHPDIASSLQDTGLLDNAFRRLEAIGFQLGEIDITAQDEFSLDVCFPIPSQTNYLVLGVT